MFLRSVHIFILLLFSAFLVSCREYEASISYKVTNKSNQEIKVVFFNTDGEDRSTYYKRDSVFIGVNSEKVLVIQSKGISRVSNYKETDTHLREFQYLEVYQDSIKSKTDFSLSSEWDYTEQDAHTATYVCIVYQSDF